MEQIIYCIINFVETQTHSICHCNEYSFLRLNQNPPPLVMGKPVFVTLLPNNLENSVYLLISVLWYCHNFYGPFGQWMLSWWHPIFSVITLVSKTLVYLMLKCHILQNAICVFVQREKYGGSERQSNDDGKSAGEKKKIFNVPFQNRLYSYADWCSILAWLLDRTLFC